MEKSVIDLNHEVADWLNEMLSLNQRYANMQIALIDYLDQYQQLLDQFVASHQNLKVVG